MRVETATVEGDANARLMFESARFVPGGVHTAIRVVDPPLCIRRAKGAYLWDENGKRLIDYHAAFSPIILGHCHAAVVERVVQTIRATDLYGVSTTELELEISRKIVEHVPSIEQVLLCCTGSEATFHAVRVSRAFTGRQKIIKFQGCYHGWHDSVLRNVISPADRVGARDPGSAGMLEAALDTTLVCSFNDFGSVEQAVRNNAGQIAAIILEPIQHNIGCVLPDQSFLEGLRQICDREGIVLIFDEVITGFRHHIGGYQSLCKVIPDLTTLGKAIANGFPLAALGGRREIMQRFNTRPEGDVFFSGTFNGHPSGTAAGLATIAELARPGAYEELWRLGEKMRAGLREIIHRNGFPCTVAGFGSVFTTYFMQRERIRNYEDLLPNDAALYVNYRRNLIGRGVFETPLNLKRNQVSLSHTDADIELTLEIAEYALRATFDARARREI
jgi:glutamate-1-semialdehyde 2,1-aminomutase